MSGVLMWILIIGFTAFFSVLLIYTFAVGIFTKFESKQKEVPNREFHDLPHDKIRPKFIGRS
ncbi:hypothetical protein JXJ21_20920 [candidate division KSB1 bacterium]|nr:hypothetical protein [candidate division KSB1 bacterium]